MRFKLQPCDVQETLLGLLGHCLSVLQERDKSACILNRHKTLEARRVSDLRQDFTDFYDEWGLWEEDIHMFLNTIKDRGATHLSGLLLLQMFRRPRRALRENALENGKAVPAQGHGIN
jgi:hypothetical protein